MLTNKKTYIRLIAVVMALMMTVAVFAGCNNQAVKDAQASADAANQAAADVQKAADSIAQAAADLKNQLEEANQRLDEQKDQLDSMAQDAADAHDRIDSYHGNTTAAPETSAPIIENDWINDTATGKTLYERLSALQNDYLTVKKQWYTAENYAKVKTIFDKASYEFMRATDTAGLEQIIAEASAAAAAVDSIATDAAKIQAMIEGFGDVYTELFTSHEPKVVAAREAFDAWVEKYEESSFAPYGLYVYYDEDGNVSYIVNEENDYANRAKLICGGEWNDDKTEVIGGVIKLSIKSGYNGLIAAETKIAQLKDDAENAIKAMLKIELTVAGCANPDAIINVLYAEGSTQNDINKMVDQYKLFKAIITKNGITYADAKANAEAIEAAYTQYRIFWNANGGDDTPISAVDSATLLTGEEFVKLYVLELYNGQLNEYQNLVEDYLNTYIVEYFMNTNNTSALKAANPALAKYLAGFTTPAVNYNDNGEWYVKSVGGDITFGVDASSDVVTVYGTGATVDPTFTADGAKIKKDFTKVVVSTINQIVALEYDKDFKGNKSLADAFLEIDQILVKAIAELAQVYYDDVVAVYMVDQLDQYEETLKNAYANDDGVAPTGANVTYKYTAKADRHDAYYYDYDNAFYNNMTKLIADAKKSVQAFKVTTYDALNTIENKDEGIKNIKDQKLFTVTYEKGLLKSIDLYLSDSVNDPEGKDSAITTVLNKSVYNSSARSFKSYFTKGINIEKAVEFHELKIDYAEALDELVGIGTVADNKVTYTVASVLAADVDVDENDKIDDAEKYTSYMDQLAYILNAKVDATGYTKQEAATYTALNTVRNTGRNAIMALEFMNYDTAVANYTNSSYAAQTSKGKAIYSGVKALSTTTTADKNTAVNVIVDVNVVAEAAIIDVFADGADAVLKAFCDICRSTLKTNVADVLAPYKNNYHFGGLDTTGVYLEKDMNDYVAYLESLATLEAISGFAVKHFGLLEDAVAEGKDKDALETLGYTVQTIQKDTSKAEYSYLLHITSVGATVDQITGINVDTANSKGWYTLATDKLDEYLMLNNDTWIAGQLEDVRVLAYLKDDVVSTILPKLLKEFTGVWDATTGDWKYEIVGLIPVDQLVPVVPYEYGTKRAEVYLAQLNAAYERIVDEVEAITLLADDANDNRYTLATAKTTIGTLDLDNLTGTGILGQAVNENPVWDEADDLSLMMAYVRYYQVGQYDWTKYYANID
ncbi:MAG: hypothetical protein IJY27_03075 [Clostridia bacterium]|nr:hypothetical protein [Clostridia bacterium]